MSFNLLSPQNLQYALPIAVGLGVGLVIVLFLRSGRNKKGMEYAPKPNLRSSHWVDHPATNADPADRRTSVRREGTPVKIVIQSSAFKTGTNTGYVLDRSTGGLRIAMEAGMAPGSTLQIRASHAPETIPWVTVIVRNCKDAGDHYEVGCEFDKMPPWNVLLLFG
jgi:hypothetical protein